MKKFLAILPLLMGAISAACSSGGMTGADLGSPNDQGTGQDQSATDGPRPGSGLSLIAGGLGGWGSADGTGAAARFDRPFATALDGAGNLYVSEHFSNTIRKIVLATGEVTTLAGAAETSGSADGIGPAARFNGPRGLAADGQGNLYVADSSNNTIRKIVLATGMVTTLAGAAGMSGSTNGTGAAARFSEPTGLAMDAGGNLYVADSFNSTIRKVVVATGAVTTLAGTAGTIGSADGTGPAAQFYAPHGLTIDAGGNLYVTDSNRNTIRKVVVATGVVTTVAGTAGVAGSIDGTGTAAQFNNPIGVAVDVAGNLYVGDTDNNTIRKVVAATGVVTTLAGSAVMSGSIEGTGSAARFKKPIGVAVDTAGNLYVADVGNHTIRKVVVTSGVVTTLAGSVEMIGSSDGTGTAARFYNPSGVTMDGTGNLYVADAGNHTIRKVVAATGVVTTVAGSANLSGSSDGTGTAARFYNPFGVAVDGSGNLYVTDSFNNTIRKVVMATGAVTTLAGTAGTAGSSDGTGTAAQFSRPAGVTLDGTGNLYVADGGNNTIRKVAVATGAVTTVAGTAGVTGGFDGTGATAQFNSPVGLTLDGAGNLYVADSMNDTIRKMVLATGMVTTLAGTAGMIGSSDGTGAAARFNQPGFLGVDGAGNLYVADIGNGTIRKVQISSASVTTYVGSPQQRGVVPGPLPARLAFPLGLAVLPSGDLFLTDEAAVLMVH